MSQFKSNSVIHVDIQPEAGLVIFTVQGQPDALRLSLDDIHPDMIRYAALHGLKQRVCDAAALDCDPETGRRPTAEEKYLEMQRIIEHLTSGTDQWRLNGTSGAPRQSLLLTCLREQFPTKPLEALQDYVKGLTAKQKRALLTSEPLASITSRLRRESAPNGEAIAKELLAELS